MARRSGFPLRSQRSSGVARDWGAGPGSSSVQQFSATGSGILGAGVVTTVGELTLLRTRGILDMQITGPPTSDGDGFFGAVGIGVFTDQAFTAGIASLPTPLDEREFSWLWHQFFSVHGGDVSLDALGTHNQFEVDSKAMRKFNVNDVIAGIIQVVEIGAAGLDVWFDTRILFQDSGR